MNILVAGDFRWNGGSSHVVYNYHQWGPDYGCSVKVSSQYGSLDSRIGDFIPVCSDASWADHLVLVFESFQYLTIPQIEEIRSHFSRKQITIIDPDGRYGPSVYQQGDSNHKEYTRESWQLMYESLSDRILQPRLSELPGRVRYFPYFGMESPPVEKPSASAAKKYAIQYVGNNWYRWEIIKEFFTEIHSIRNDLGRIALKGMRWDGQVEQGFEDDTRADTEFLRNMDIETSTSVAFGQVIAAMSEALVSPLFVRPMISAQMLITPRMFETLCADTIPVFRKDDGYIRELYGEEGQEFCLGEDPAAKLCDILAHPVHYFDVARTVRNRLFAQHNYRLLLSKLMEQLG